jgi:capsular exopolysaccharide synthesis family protein
VEGLVQEIIDQVRREGDSALRLLTAELDRADLSGMPLAVGEEEYDAAEQSLTPEVREAITVAVENVTKFPIIGQLLHNTKDTQLVVAQSPKSSVSESFRSLRTNIQYLVQGKEQVTVMVTADMASAGKTFVAMNLASVYAQYGKKTVLLGFDLRKPKIYHDFHLSNDQGITTYLIGKSTIDDIIQPSGKIEHLDLIMAGPVPPNPAELIASEKTKKLFAELRKRYDYICHIPALVQLFYDLLYRLSLEVGIKNGYNNRNRIDG